MKFIWGQENYLINREVKKIVKDFAIEPTYYNENSLIDEIIMDISTIGLFDDSKLIVMKNHPVLTKGVGATEFISSITNLDESVTLIITLEADKLDRKNDVIKFLLANANVQEFSKISEKDIVPTIKDIVKSKGGSISNSAAIKLAGKVPNDLRIIIAELEKLLLESDEITDKMVEISIGDYLKDDFFALSNAIVSRDVHGIMMAFQARIENGDDTTIIISQISSVLNLALQISSYKKQGLSNQDISNKTKIHIFRVKKSAELVSGTSTKELEQLILDLAQLDKDIKTGQVDKDKGLEYFLLKLIK